MGVDRATKTRVRAHLIVNQFSFQIKGRGPGVSFQGWSGLQLSSGYLAGHFLCSTVAKAMAARTSAEPPSAAQAVYEDDVVLFFYSYANGFLYSDMPW